MLHYPFRVPIVEGADYSLVHIMILGVIIFTAIIYILGYMIEHDYIDGKYFYWLFSDMNSMSLDLLQKIGILLVYVGAVVIMFFVPELDMDKWKPRFIGAIVFLAVILVSLVVITLVRKGKKITDSYVCLFEASIDSLNDYKKKHVQFYVPKKLEQEVGFKGFIDVDISKEQYEEILQKLPNCERFAVVCEIEYVESYGHVLRNRLKEIKFLYAIDSDEIMDDQALIEKYKKDFPDVVEWTSDYEWEELNRYKSYFFNIVMATIVVVLLVGGIYTFISMKKDERTVHACERVEGSIGKPLSIQVATIKRKTKEERQKEREKEEKLREKGKQMTVLDEPVEEIESFTEYDMTITKCDLQPGSTLGLSDEYDVLKVQYHIDTEKNVEGKQQWYDNLHLYGYAVTKSGHYLYPLKQKYVTDYFQYDLEQAYDNGVNDTIRYKDGVLYYVLKKGDLEGLDITYIEYTGTLKKPIKTERVFRINDLGVE